MRGSLSRLLVVVACALASSIAHAEDCPRTYEVVTYYQPKSLPKLDTRCTYDKKGVCTKVQLQGYLFKPAATTKSHAPLIVYAHGSGADPKPECVIGSVFSSLGYIVFEPIR